MSTPTQRSLEYLRKQGYIVGIVEQTIHFPDKQRPGKMTMFKRDLFNIFDLVAAGPGGIIGVQTTSRSNQQSRIQKIQGSREADKWLAAGGHIHVHGWKLAGARGKRKTWEVMVHVMGRDEVASEEPVAEIYKAAKEGRMPSEEAIKEVNSKPIFTPENLDTLNENYYRPALDNMKDEAKNSPLAKVVSKAQSDTLFEPEVLPMFGEEEPF